ncbi:MAG: hypothetical protein IT557_13125 [Alphaproteobacteria bacterium]|nr:hypothetical protein [Alphaproteobacteria bacterium]
MSKMPPAALAGTASRIPLASLARRPAALFVRDFDADGIDAEAEARRPRFTQAEMEAARAEARAAGEKAGRAAAEAAASARTANTLQTIARTLDAAEAEAGRIATESALAAARLVIGALGTAGPQLAARFGPAEAEALAATLLPHLAAEPRISLRLAPADAEALTPRLAELAAHAGTAAGALVVQPDAALAPGDVRIAWRDGTAARDHAAIWHAILGALAAAGLDLPAGATSQEA